MVNIEQVNTGLQLNTVKFLVKVCFIYIFYWAMILAQLKRFKKKLKILNLVLGHLRSSLCYSSPKRL